MFKYYHLLTIIICVGYCYVVSLICEIEIKSTNQLNINHMKALNFIIELLMVIALIAIIVAGVCFFINTMIAVYCFLAALGFSFLFAILSVFEN